MQNFRQSFLLKNLQKGGLKLPRQQHVSVHGQQIGIRCFLFFSTIHNSAFVVQLGEKENDQIKHRLSERTSFYGEPRLLL
jgi:hypothetical protein